VTFARPRITARQLLAILLCVTVLIGAPGQPAAAEPLPTTPPNEGGNATLDTLRKNLEAAAAGYVEAQNSLEVSKARQAQLTTELASVEAELGQLRKVVGAYAAEAYRTGRLGTVSAMLGAKSQEGFLAKASALSRITERDDRRLATLSIAQKRAETAKAGIDAEVANQAALLVEIEKRKTAADKALTTAGMKAARGSIDPNSPNAKPAPRNANGSWPTENCTINDPTTSGCITPRTSHALLQAKANGFTRYVSCYAPGAYEHPKGRACDFASATGGFGGTASGGDRTYGDQLASFFVKNASALGVLYVIWFCQIWINGAWKSYSSTGGTCGDSPSGDHTNHVHLSMY
jgi:peptidoglycan DL-endopeptidase CwlO